VFIARSYISPIQTGALTACLSDNAQKVTNLAGITLGTILQSFSTIITGIIIGFIAGPKVAAVGLACIPLVLSTGYIRLLLVLPNERAKKLAHEKTAQVACESAGAIRTVASLTRETDCVRRYSEALEGPLRRTRKTGLWSAGLFAATQAVGFGAIALVFWYGAGLVSTLEYNVGQFFVSLLTVTFGAIQAGT
jgi:ATP-binding cassette subfamily B (MDR/TAP) protein 1